MTAANITRLALKVSPKASRNAVVGWMGDTLKVAVTTAPEKGKANQAVIDVLSAALGVPRSAIKVVRGRSSPNKVIEIAGWGEGEILRRLHKPAA